MKKYHLKKIKIRNQNNKKRLLKTGTTLDNVVYFQTTDYDLNTILDFKIKDIKREELKKAEIEDPFYFKYHTENMFLNINRSDCLFGDWWRIGTKNKIIYLTIITPHLRHLNEEYIDYEISSLIKKHYNLLFGYEDIKLKIKKENLFELEENKNSPDELIKEWVSKNKNSNNYEFYKELILNHNYLALSQKDISLSNYIYDKNSVEVIIPFNCELTYPELFKMILNGDIKKKEHLNEDYIEKDLTKDLTPFLIQFKQEKNKIKKRK